jgi:hypothetical protein
MLPVGETISECYVDPPIGPGREIEHGSICQRQLKLHHFVHQGRWYSYCSIASKLSRADSYAVSCRPALIFNENAKNALISASEVRRIYDAPPRSR